METARARGARFALDDFGIGFTSFARLRSLATSAARSLCCAPKVWL